MKYGIAIFVAVAVIVLCFNSSNFRPLLEPCFRKDSGGGETLRARYFRVLDGEECGYFMAKGDDLWEAQNDGYGGGGYVHYFSEQGQAEVFVESKCPVRKEPYAPNPSNR